MASVSVSTFVDVDGYLAFVLTLLLLISLYVVFYYAEQGFPMMTFCTCVVGYYCAFGVLLTVPIDIATVVMDRRSTSETATLDYTTHIYKLSTLYNFFFTVILIWGNVVLVFEEYYNTDGYFTIIGRFASSIYRVLKDIVLYLIVGLIMLAILIGQKAVPSSADALKMAAVILTNIVYESFLMFLLGFGLVEFPKEVWISSSAERSLSVAETKAAFDLKAASDALWDVTNLGGSVILTKKVVEQYGDPKLVNAIQILESETEKTNATGTSEVATNKQGQVTIDTLAALRLKLNYAKDQYRMAQARAEDTMIHAYTCEDILKAKSDGKLYWSVLAREATPLEYKWFVTYRPWAMKISAIVLALMSLFSFIGVCSCMAGADNSASIYYKAVHDPSASAGGIVIFIFGSLGYTAYITSWALFQMNFAGLMILVKYSTTPESLSFNVRMIARLAAPLAFFYLGWISESGLRSGPWTTNMAAYHYELRNVTHINTTISAFPQSYNTTELVPVPGGVLMMSAFSHFYSLGDIDVVRKSFGTIFPVILIVIVCLTVTNVYNRLCVLAKMQKWQFGTPLCDESTLNEGKKKLKNQKDRILRKAQNANFASHIRMFGKKKVPEEESGPMVFFKNRKKGGPPAPMVEIAEPAHMADIVERKVKSSIGFGTSWKPFFAEIRPPGELHFFKDEHASQSNTVDPGVPASVKLSLMITLEMSSVGGNRDDVELVLDFGDDKIALRIKSLGEGQKWKTALEEWKSYSITVSSGKYRRDEGDDDNDGENDVEQGSKARSISGELNALTFENNTGEFAKKEKKSQLLNIFKRSGGGGGAQSSEQKGLLESAGGGGGSSGSSSSPKPHVLEGYLEKKHHIGAMHVASEWQKVFCKIDEPTTSLFFFKASNLNSPAGSIDLKMASSIEVYEKGTRKEDPSRFNIDMGDGKVYKFKARGAAEGEEWLKSLSQWRDYFLLM